MDSTIIPYWECERYEVQVFFGDPKHAYCQSIAEFNETDNRNSFEKRLKRSQIGSSKVFKVPILKNMNEQKHEEQRSIFIKQIDRFFLEASTTSMAISIDQCPTWNVSFFVLIFRRFKAFANNNSPSNGQGKFTLKICTQTEGNKKLVMKFLNEELGQNHTKTNLMMTGKVIPSASGEAKGPQGQTSDSTCAAHFQPNDTAHTERPINYAEDHSKDKGDTMVKSTGRSKPKYRASSRENESCSTESMSDSRLSSHETRVSAPGGQTPQASGKSRHQAPVSRTAELPRQCSVKVQVETGSLELIKADVLAYPVWPDLDLASGYIDKALLKRTGQRLQAELEVKNSDEIRLGDVAVFEDVECLDNRMHCRYIFRCALEPITTRTTQRNESTNDLIKQNILAYVCNCLKEADERKCRSVAFSVVDINFPGYDTEFAANQMFYAITQFNPSQKNVARVFFVVHPGYTDTLQAYKNEESRFMQFMEPKTDASYATRTSTFALSANENCEGLGIASSTKGSHSHGKQPESLDSENTTSKLYVTGNPDSELDNMKQYDSKFCDMIKAQGVKLRIVEHGIIVDGPNSLVNETRKRLKQLDGGLKCCSVTLSSQLDKITHNKLKQLCTELCVNYTIDDRKLSLSYSKLKTENPDIFKEIEILLSASGIIIRIDDDDAHMIQEENIQSSANNVLQETHNQRGKKKDTETTEKSKTTPDSKVQTSIAENSTAKGLNSNTVVSDSDKTMINGTKQKHQKQMDHFSWSQHARCFQVYHTTESILVKVYCCDILMTPVDCIVNAANEYLEHAGGLAKAIANTAGDELIKESKAIIKTRGKLSPGSVCKTTAGHLGDMYRCVIHAVGPCWSDYEPHTKEKVLECEKHIYDAVLNSLREAESVGVKKIAFPTISSGIYACPKDMCCVQYAKAAIDYSGLSENRIEEIHFVDVDESMVKMIHTYFGQMFPSGKVPSSYRPDVYFRKDSFMHSEERAISRACTGDHRVRVTRSAGDSLELEFGKGQLLHVRTGDVLGLKGVDMIVCSDNQRGSGRAMLASTILQQSGKEYQEKKKDAFQRGAKHGDVIVCKGYKINFKWIAHAILFPRNMISDPPTRKLEIEEMFTNVFEQLHQKGGKSVALPLLGTGKGHEDPGYYAERLFDALVQYCRTNKKKLNVYLVNIDDDNTKRAIAGFEHKLSNDGYACAGPGNRQNKGDGYASAGPDNRQNQGDGYASAGPGNRQNKGDRYASAGPGNRQNKGSGQEQALLASANGPESNRRKEVRPSSRIGEVRRSEERKLKSSSLFFQSGEDEASANCKPPDDDEFCVICMDTPKKPKRLKQCGHVFCNDCIDNALMYKEVCPMCGVVLGVIEGDQPYGTMAVRTNAYASCEGYGDVGRIEITYNFADGRQEPNHPCPGAWYKGIRRTAYLPANKQGHEIVKMLEIAFDRKLIFTIGSSRTTGKEGVITWNDIHHKTDARPNTQFGYPDDTYLDRVTDELKAKGVTPADIPGKMRR